MPVIECSCGMVMSVAARDPRVCCIRCGGVEFHILERREDGQRLERIARRSSAGNASPTLVFTGIGAVLVDSLSCVTNV